MNIWKERLPDKVFNVVAIILLIFLAILTLYPFWYLLVYSLNDPLDAMHGGLYLSPRVFSTASYKLVWLSNNLPQALLVSISRTVIGTVVMAFFTSMLAYVLSRQELIGRRVFNSFFILTMYLNAGLVPWYLTLKLYGFVGSYMVYIIPGMISVWSMILIRVYMQEIGAELSESAKIDGANDFSIFIRVMLPVCKPVLAVIIVFGAVGQWNSWFDTAVFNQSNNNLFPLQYILMNMIKNATITSSSQLPTANATSITMTPESLRAAITIIATVPIIAVYPFFQKYFAQGIMLGAVKG